MRFLAACVVSSLVIACALPDMSRAGEINLPDIGTNVRYDYFLSTPQFLVANQAPSEELFQAEAVFSESRHLFVEFESEPRGMQIDLTFTGPGLRELFEPVHISFNETMSLLFDDGEVSTPKKNDGVGYSDNPDEYIFSWGFFPETDVSVPNADFDLYGLRWSVSPDLIGGAVLPSNISLRASIFANGAIWVVPEPGGFGSLFTAAIWFGYLCRRRSFACQLA